MIRCYGSVPINELRLALPKLRNAITTSNGSIWGTSAFKSFLFPGRQTKSKTGETMREEGCLEKQV